jgi:serralysin
MAGPMKICTVVALDDALQQEAALKAITENPLNAGQPDLFDDISGAVEALKKWAPGRTLRVRFMDGDPTVQQKVADVAKGWSEVANIFFDFGDDPDAEIRISFKMAGSWSYIGTDALLIPQSMPTMNYGWLTPTTDDEEYARVVLHEFGHAIGFIHEHQNPEQGVNWNEQAVLEYYMGPPNNWDERTTRFNVLDKYDPTLLELTKFDPDSIMLYPVPAAFTTDGFEVEWQNHELSELDKELAQRIYPFEEESDETELSTDADC